MLLHIGLDDTDSLIGGCTTHIAAKLIEKFQSLDVNFIDYPNLLRLNPNVPWKTRGNGAICLRIEVNLDTLNVIRKTVENAVESYADFGCDNTNPGIVFYYGSVHESLKWFSDDVVGGVIELEKAFRLIDKLQATAIGYKNMRGIIGALAAVGGLQCGDHTYEFLAYRKPENYGKPRMLKNESIKKMDEKIGDYTFNNIDSETGRILITPRGPDPVLFGIRGETAKSVYEAGKMINSEEQLDSWIIFRSNQGTDAHFREPLKIFELGKYKPAVTFGKVMEKPKTILGGHVIFSVCDETGEIDCAAYEPTGRFRDVVRQFLPGDALKVYGGIKENRGKKQETINLEKIEVLKLVSSHKLVNPKCPQCRKVMESMGKNKGYRCRKCGLRNKKIRKQLIEVKRFLETGLYIPPPRAQRHLTKPRIRYGKEKDGNQLEKLFNPWFWFSE